jgi:pimeloyl-ACP methyl ester carboxylesterase
MTTTAQEVPTHHASAYGTRIAAFVSGRGRPLVVVHGTTSYHGTWSRVLPLLSRHAEVHAIDRRGRGASGDALGYSIALEYADVAAVVDAVAAATGRDVDLLGHSYGGNVAFGAATLTARIRRLVLYEGWPVPNVAHRRVSPDVLTQLENLVAEGRPEQMLETVFRDIAKMSELEIGLIKAAATWPARVAAAPTVPREVRAFGEQAFDPSAAAEIDVPVLLLVGEHSPEDIKADPDIVAAALPDARIQVLPGQMHMAHLTAPEDFAREVLAFLDG